MLLLGSFEIFCLSLLSSAAFLFFWGEEDFPFEFPTNSTVNGWDWLTKYSVQPDVRHPDSPRPKDWPSREDGLGPSCGNRLICTHLCFPRFVFIKFTVLVNCNMLGFLFLFYLSNQNFLFGIVGHKFDCEKEMHFRDSLWTDTNVTRRTFLYN